jgi:hypothetical protein
MITKDGIKLYTREYYKKCPFGRRVATYAFKDTCTVIELNGIIQTIVVCGIGHHYSESCTENLTEEEFLSKNSWEMLL